MATIRYSIQDIDRMRHLVDQLIFQQRSFDGISCDSWPEKSEIEERLRTYMINGTTLRELEEAVGEAEKENAEFRAEEAERRKQERLCRD